ncbi:MAG: hypothetical protein ACYDBB_26585 [Armatimonadota bacterium]
MKYQWWVWAVLLLIVTALAWAADVEPIAVPRSREHGPSPEVMACRNCEKTEIYRLRIVNDANGDITGSHDQGKTWEPIGHVVAYSQKVTNQGYTASKWARNSAIAATAVNAIHVRTGYNAKDDKGIVFSILPQEMQTEAGKKLASFTSPDGIYTDIPGGTGIFGGHWAPILGNPMYLEKPAGLEPMPEGYVPHKGDVFVVCVLEPVDSPMEFVFENRFGGMITMVGWDGARKVIGQVLKPVCGVGRFTGTQYTDIGRLRANHNGVIDISVSPNKTIGGFQIIPREHAMSTEMVRARTFTQWMVIGPLDARDPSWEGTAPLFLDYMRPSWGENDWDEAGSLDKICDRTLIQVRIKEGSWQPLPSLVFDPDLKKPLPDWANTALQDVTHVRIILPVPERLRTVPPQKVP